jgi:predicted oxidoreductase
MILISPGFARMVGWPDGCRAAGSPVPGLFAAGEVAGFGGGGVHGYRSLEGSFLGGCLFSGRQAGRSAAAGTAS